MKATGDIAFVWRQFGPYHMDRCEAVGEHYWGRRRVYGIEIAPASKRYAWSATGPGQSFRKIILYPGQRVDETNVFRRAVDLLQACLRSGARHIFLCHYEDSAIFLVAIALRLARRRVFIMQESKYDDKPRFIWEELIKFIFYFPYCGALVGGIRTASYLRFLGFRRRPIVMGYDAVSVARLVEEAGQPIAPEGLSFNDRYFVLVARLVLKKDIATAVAAYARYREIAGDQARQFHICGSGPLEAELRALVERLNLDGVVFHGFLQSRDVARTLSGGVALIVTSVSEQWGLVVNEALALGLPVLATDNVGARDLLLRTAVSGYIFEPGNVEGLAQLMFAVARDETEWRRLVSGAHTLRMEGDTGRFVEGVVSLVEPGLAVPRVVPDLVEAVIDERYE
jgi:L-malate glycosyltransferase